MKSPLESGSEVLHPQWGKGTVLFDKPHCIGIRFLEYGHVNFSQEEWARQRSPAERFRGCIGELEYNLDNAVEEGSLSEDQACEMLKRGAHALEVRRKRGLLVDDAYVLYTAGQLGEEDFYGNLVRFVTSWVGRNSNSSSDFQIGEEAISESLLEVWQRLKDFDPKRTGFKTFVSIIVRSNIYDQQRRARSQRGHAHYVPLEEDTLGASRELNQEKRFLFDEWLQKFDPTDRRILQYMRDGLTQEEIAQALAMTQQGVAWRLARIKREENAPF